MTERTVRATPQRRLRISVKALVTPLIHLFNPAAKLIAGTRILPFWAVLRHQGRRSGKMYATPVVARRTPEGFVMPVAFGEDSDWIRNLTAKGEGVIRWSGVEHRVVDPTIVEADSAVAAFSGFERWAIRLVGLKRFLKVRMA